MSACQVTAYRSPFDEHGKFQRRGHPCGQPVTRLGLCKRHAAEHERLCDGCERCQP